MKDFKGFGDWIEIFRGGRQTDSGGKEHDGDELIDRAVATFNAEEHEPPLVVGHPKDNAPAYGWIRELKSEAVGGVKRLFARAADVVPEFEELVKAGLYKKRSAAFYPDGRLRHVGFLGAMPPAVKGLADLKFEEDEPVSFEFYDYNLGRIGRMFARLREWLIEKEGIDAADRIIPDWDVDDMKQEANRPEEQTSAVYNEEPEKTEVEMTEEGKQFSEAEVTAREEAAAAKAREEGKKEAERQFAEAQRKRSIDEFIARNFPTEGKGKLPPALLDAGVRQFMEQLGGETIEFAEGRKETGLAWFMNFLEGLPKSGMFEEVATRDKDVGGGNAGGKMATLIATKRQAKPDLSYGAAFAEVQTENPDLAKEYLTEMGRE